MLNKLNIFQASAGSGKTRTLVKEYLEIALSNPGNYKSTLAITFTNKATEEMKSRVVDYLIALSKGGEQQLASELKDSLTQKGKLVELPDIQNLSSEVLKNILHDYSNFHISTIDSFCIKVLRSFAKELGLPVGFNVELDTDKVLEDITAKLLDRIGTDEELTKYIDDYILYRLDEGRTWNIADDLKEIGREIFSEDYWKKKLDSKTSDVYGDRNKTAELISEIGKIKFTFENYIKTKAGEIKSVIESDNLTHDDFVNKSRGGAYSYMLKILNKNDYEPSVSLRNVIGKDGDLLKTKSPKSAIINKAVREIVDFYDKNLAGYITANAVFKTIYNIGIFSDLLKLLDDYRKENHVMISADINNLLRSLMSDDLSPFIYEKLGSRIRNIMIDEFQDTSGFQWNNLKPLVINAISERNSALIVGDVKQSIYRWRSGDMRLLLEGVERDLSAFKELISKETLNTNFRSHKNIVDFNNKFFLNLVSNISNEDETYFNHYLSESYEEKSLVQKNSGKKNHGYVKIKVFPYNKESDIDTNSESEEYTKDILSELKNDGYKPNDILVLVRTGAESISISSLITSLGYDVISEKSLLVNNSPSVRMLIYLLKYISDNRNHLAKTGVLYNYSILSGGEHNLRMIFEDGLNKRGEHFNGIMPEEFFKDADKHRIKSILNDLVLYDLIEHLVSIFKLDKKADPYIIKFLDTAYRYSKDNDADVTSFLEYWETNRNKLSIGIPENTDGIRVMTIHKAKGLQSRVVIIPYANWELDANGNRTSMWASSDKPPFNKASGFFVKASSDLAESYFVQDYITERALTRLDNVNLLYVAFTRPAERLYINVPEKRIKSIGNRIAGVLNSFPEFSEKFTDNVFETGDKKKASELSGGKEEEKITVTEQKDFVSELWYKKTVIKPAYKKLKIADAHNVKINRGVLIHDLLSRLKTAKDVDGCINSAHVNGLINSGETEEYKKILIKIVTDAEVKDWYEDNWTVMNESEILTAEGKTVRPDRVLIKDKEAVIIDYKTGKERKEDEEQLKEYEILLKQMGYIDIKKYLLYIGDYNGKIFKVKEIR
ncbi:MAG: UvrD-helicase domain-containing protein [Ignavibacteria bacterium]|nr:UvrD-helicase domain-containing protein [Ignavibacteria bacterium]